MCGFCQGKSCSNTVNVDELDDDEDLDIGIENAIERFEDYQSNPEYETDVVESQDDIEAYIEQPSTSKKDENWMSRQLQSKLEVSKVGIVD